MRALTEHSSDVDLDLFYHTEQRCSYSVRSTQLARTISILQLLPSIIRSNFEGY